MGNLNALKADRENKPGRYADGGGLYLLVKEGGSKVWVFRYSLAGRRREMGLGSFKDMGLSDARDRTYELRQKVKKGIDPINDRILVLAEKRASEANRISLATCIENYVQEHQIAWTNKRQPEQWRNCFTNHVDPIILALPVSAIDREHILRILRPIWSTKCETAARVRNRLDRILGYATVMGYRKGENPAAWRGNLDHILPARSKMKGVEHFPSVHRDEVTELIGNLRAAPTTPNRALEFLILTATRTSEALGMIWDEIDFDGASWTIPPARMKARREHRVPLSKQALDLLIKQRSLAQNQFVFPSRIAGRHLSNMALLMVMRRLGRFEVPHGFRSTFKDWASECTNHSNEISEMALAHAIKDRTEAAYRRGDLFEKRRVLMQDWADFCLPEKLNTESNKNDSN